VGGGRLNIYFDHTGCQGASFEPSIQFHRHTTHESNDGISNPYQREGDIQMTSAIQKHGFILLFVLLLFSFSSVSYGGNECKIKYGWNTGNSLQGTFKNHSNIIYLNTGETKTINQNRMNYVKNLTSQEVKFYLENASDVTLVKNQQNPGVGTYVVTVKLVKAKCLATSSSSPSFPDVNKTPSPAGPIPIPYPNIRK
jgi:hypothetical protein